MTAPAFGVYLHVPFCATRCGYCDFNTYTAGELGTGASTGSYLDAIARELELGAESLAAAHAESGEGAGVRPAETVFIGGGTPSLLGADGLARLLDGVRDTFGLAPGAEVTREYKNEKKMDCILDYCIRKRFYLHCLYPVGYFSCSVLPWFKPVYS